MNTARIASLSVWAFILLVVGALGALVWLTIKEDRDCDEAVARAGLMRRTKAYSGCIGLTEDGTMKRVIP